MKFIIERCPYWNGKEKVCDNKRCTKRKNFPSCYHKPFKINGRLMTVKDAILKILK